MKQYLFIGEKRSNLAIKMGYTWEQGRLAGKQLFNALKNANIDPKDVKFHNWFEHFDSPTIVQKYVKNLWTIVAMGNKVHQQLINHNIDHLHMIHPAARGKIRAKERYFAHLKETLGI